MDDINRLKVEFLVGDKGDPYVVSQPTEGQMLMLSLSREQTSGENIHRLAQRMFRIIERVMGDTEWRRLEDAVIDERYTATEILEFVQAVVSFKWSDHSPGVISVIEEPVNGLTLPEPRGAAVRPAPRVVGG